MSSVVAADEGGEVYGPVVPKGLRLGDAERIASQRLDGAAEGSLKEALAIAPVDATAAAGGTRLTDRVEAVQQSFDFEPLAPFAETSAPEIESWMPGTEAESESRLELPLAPAVPSYTREADPAPSVESWGPVLADRAGDAPWPDTQSEAPPNEGLAAHPEGPASTGLSSPSPVESARPDILLPPARDVQPLASVLDSAAKLTADANAATEALENLKRMLAHRSPNRDLAQDLMQELARDLAKNQDQPESQALLQPQVQELVQGLISAQSAPERTLEPAAPPPLPAFPPPGPEAAASHPLPVVIPTHTDRPRMGVQVRGFLAGFALSWPIGAVLYFIMTAG